jgi:hypothetical protein
MHFGLKIHIHGDILETKKKLSIHHSFCAITREFALTPKTKFVLAIQNINPTIF